VKLSTKILVLYTSLIINTHGQDNQLVLRSFVKEDTVLLRWAPVNADVMIKGLKNGYFIYRSSDSACPGKEASGAAFTILPFQENKNRFLNSADPDVRQLAALVDELSTSSSLPAETKKMAFSVLMLAASTNKEIAGMLGIYYEDITCAAEYQYKVGVRNSTETSIAISVNSASLTNHQPFTLLAGSARPKLKQAYLSWEAKSLQDGYSAYWIERSIDSIHFEKRNYVPYLFLRSSDEPNKVNCDFADTSVQEGVAYFYRICGISHFGETGNCSNVVRVYVPLSLYGECRIDSISANGFTRQISGKFIPRAGVPSGASGTPKYFVLMRSDSLESGFEVLSKQENAEGLFNFAATVAVESGDRHYYKVAAVSEDNDTAYSFPYYFFTLDQIPPSIPQNLSGMINDSGVVSLGWTQNPEADIRGYRIFRSNALHEEFTEITTAYCAETSFKDTLRLDNLTPEVYYRMVAVDFNFNNSETTAPVLLLKPDTIPPVSAVFINYTVKTNGVFLQWANSSSKDVAENYLVRFHNNKADTIFTWSDTVQTFEDLTGTNGSTYNYTVITRDRSGNISRSALLAVNYETGIRPGVSELSALTDRAQKQIVLSWKCPVETIYSIQVYRSKNDEPFRLVKTIRDKAAISFVDKDLNINNTYRYKLKVVYESGVSSVMSVPLTVVY
jgi:uncharacterized protein